MTTVQDSNGLADRLDESAAKLRSTVSPDEWDEGADEACAVADIFEAAAAMMRRTQPDERGAGVAELLWRIVTLERLIIASGGEPCL